MPAHHAPDDILIAYAAGSLGASEALLIACHLTLCPACRRVVADAEAVGAAVLAGAAGLADPGVPRGVTAGVPADVPENMLAALLGRLDEPVPTGPVANPLTRPLADPRGVIPAPLFGLTGDLAKVSWRRMFPGIHSLDLPALGDGKLVKVHRFAAGMRVPSHDHPGLEATLVLSGGFTDDDGHFLRGDLSMRDHTRPHEQRIDPGEPCVWLWVGDGEFIPRTLMGRLLRVLFGA
jgi:putative transcriptional regulator